MEQSPTTFCERDEEAVKALNIAKEKKDKLCKLIQSMKGDDTKLKYENTYKALTDEVKEAVPDIAKRMKAWRKPKDKGLRAQIEVACGVGKTHIAIQFVDSMIRKRREGKEKIIVVVLEPRIELIRQTMKKWSQHLPDDIKNTMQVCTVCTIGFGNKKQRKTKTVTDEAEDEEGTEEDGEALMNDTSIEESWKKKRYGKEDAADIFEEVLEPDDRPTKVLFMTYQSASVLKNISLCKGMENRPIDLMVFDEAHLTCGKAK